MTGLAGLRVLDLTSYLAGPFCTRLLAHQGAEVIKVERPGRGDAARRLGPFPDDRPDPECSGHFLYLNQHKLGITLDLKTSSGADLVRRLVGDVDVLVESFRPGTMERLGLDYAALSAINPRLVMCSISSFGQSGPYRDFAADEMVFQAMSGFVYACGDPTREPLSIPFPLAQYIAGVHAYIGILAFEALASVTGRGDHLDVSILECMLAPQEPALTQYAYSQTMPRRVGYRRINLYPGTVLPCRDGWAALIVVTAAEWKNLGDLLGRPDIVDDPRFRTPSLRVQHSDEIDALLSPWLAERTAREVYDSAQRAKVPFAMVATPGELLASEHLAVRDYFDALEDPSGRRWIVPGPPFVFSDAPTPKLGRAPRLGEHNAAILGQRLGLSTADLLALSQAGVT